MSLLKSASIVSLLTLASRITGLVREQLFASYFGASATTDAFQVAFRIPNLLRRLFAEGAFSQAFVPILGETRVKQGEEATKGLIDSVATVLFWALLVVSPLALLNGLVAGFVGQGPGATAVGVLVLVGFLYLWISMLIEAEREWT